MVETINAALTRSQYAYKRLSTINANILDTITDKMPRVIKRNKWVDWQQQQRKLQQQSVLSQKDRRLHWKLEREAMKTNLQGALVAGIVGGFIGACAGGVLTMLTGGASTPLITLSATIGTLAGVFLASKLMGAYMANNESALYPAAYKLADRPKQTAQDTKPPQERELKTYSDSQNLSKTSPLFSQQSSTQATAANSHQVSASEQQKRQQETIVDLDQPCYELGSEQNANQLNL